METHKKGELAKKILLTTAAGGAFATVCVLPGLSVLFKTFNAQNTKERYRLKRAVLTMERQGYLIRTVKKGKEEIHVSEKGKERIRSYIAGEVKIAKPRRWDKKWRMVMFDIPEAEAKIRQEVSKKIKDIGMEPIQNSVFVSPFPCKKEIDVVTHHYKVQKYFIYIEADTIECDRDLLSYFGLK